MKSPGLTPTLASATLFLALSVGGLPAREMAATVPGSSVSPTEKSMRQAVELMKQFDKDGDGSLDDAERSAAKEQMIREPVRVKPAGESRPDMAGGAEMSRKGFMELFDRNNDGRIDEEERAAARKFASERGLGSADELRDELLRRFDQNANGRIDPDERAGVQQFVRGRLEQARASAPPPASAPQPAPPGNAGLEQVLRAAVEADADQRQRFDRDADGKLDDSEWLVARSEIQRWAGGGAAEPAVKSSAAAEKKRLESVASEVARRREMREKVRKPQQQ